MSDLAKRFGFTPVSLPRPKCHDCKERPALWPFYGLCAPCQRAAVARIVLPAIQQMRDWVNRVMQALEAHRAGIATARPTPARPPRKRRATLTSR